MASRLVRGKLWATAGGEGGGEKKKSPLNCSVLLQTVRLEARLIRADGICERLERISEGLITGEDKQGQASNKIQFFFDGST